MKWILSLFLCLSASAQLPIIPYVIPSASAFYPTNVTSPSALYYWFDLVPTPSFNGARDTLNGVGAIPSDGSSTLSWTNWLNYSSTFGGGWANRNTTSPIYRSSGGGNSGTTPSLDFNNGNGTRLNTGQIPTMLLTNFTLMTVIAPASASTAIQSLFDFAGNGFGYPFLELDANRLKMGNGNGTSVEGAATIQNQSYIITWINAGASSQIYTNGVLYFAASTANTIGANYPANLNICTIHGRDAGNSGIVGNDNQYIGTMSRIWVWTNVLSGADLSKATTQTKTDFGFP